MIMKIGFILLLKFLAILCKSRVRKVEEKHSLFSLKVLKFIFLVMTKASHTSLCCLENIIDFFLKERATTFWKEISTLTVSSPMFIAYQMMKVLS